MYCQSWSGPKARTCCTLATIFLETCSNPKNWGAGEHIWWFRSLAENYMCGLTNTNCLINSKVHLTLHILDLYFCSFVGFKDTYFAQAFEIGKGSLTEVFLMEGTKINKMSKTFLDHLPLSSCRHSLWTTPYQKLFWPFTVRINCSSDLKNFANSWPSPSNFKTFSWLLEQFFLTVGQYNFENKILILY